MRHTLPIIVSLLLTACVGDTVSPRAIRGPTATETPTARSAKGSFPSSGQLVVWGDNSGQQISDAPVGDEIESIAAGGGKQGLVIRRDGSLVLWGSAGVPLTTPPVPADAANDKFKDAYLVVSYGLAIRNDNTILTWGSYLDGSSAAPPPGLKARDIAGGSGHGIALGTDHRLTTWGPAAVTPPTGKFSEVGGRTLYALALRTDGVLFGLGGGFLAPDIFSGWVSDGPGRFFVPGQRFVAVAAGNMHILALRADGTVAGWGANTFGETQAPAGVRFTTIAAGLNYSVGIDEDGFIHQWGDASNGTASVPPGRFAAIAAGARHASALRAR